MPTPALLPVAPPPREGGGGPASSAGSSVPVTAQEPAWANLLERAAPARPRIAVHKFSSCDGCQLVFLHTDDALLHLAERVDIVHFAEAGPVDPDAPVDIAFVEGSLSTPEEIARIQQVRASCRYLVSLGACATSGGLQALRNTAPEGVQEWTAAVYARPEKIASLATAIPLAEAVRVDLELWGCPVSAPQVFQAIGQLLLGVRPHLEADSVCLECKRQQHVCVLVTEGKPCMGPVTRTGCGALCPGVGRDCYACFGPSDPAHTAVLATRFAGLGLPPAAIARRFRLIHSHTPAFREEWRRWDAEASPFLPEETPDTP